MLKRRRTGDSCPAGQSRTSSSAAAGVCWAEAAADGGLRSSDDHRSPPASGTQHQAGPRRSSLLGDLPRDLQVFAAGLWHPQEMARLAATCRTLRRAFADSELIWRAYCQTGVLGEGEGEREGDRQLQDQPPPPAGDSSSPGVPGTTVTSVDAPESLIGCGVGFSAGVTPNRYAHVLSSIERDAVPVGQSSPFRARLALPRSTVLPRLPGESSACTWRRVYQDLLLLSRLAPAVVTSLLMPHRDGIRGAGVLASTRDRPEQDVDQLLKLTDGSGMSSMWSSAGSPERHRADAPMDDGRRVDDWLVFRSYTHPLSWLTRVRLKVFQCHYQPGAPIYPPSYVRLRVGHDEKNMHYTSPWYRVEPHAQWQEFFFYDRKQYRSPEQHGPLMLITGPCLRLEFRSVGHRGWLAVLLADVKKEDKPTRTRMLAFAACEHRSDGVRHSCFPF